MEIGLHQSDCGARLNWPIRLQRSVELTNHIAADGLAWDWVTKKVYWTDSGRKRVEVYDPEREVRRLLKSTGSQSLPRDIAVDPTTGYARVSLC